MKNFLINPFEGRLHWPALSFDRLPRPGAAALTALVALASAVVLLAGCASPGTPLQKLDETPPAAVGLSDAAATVAPARWWSTLGDDQLAALVDKALRDQPSLAAARARVQRALALAQVTEAADGPQADLSANATRQRYPEHGLYPAPIAGSILNSGSVNAGFSWSPDWYGRQAASLASSLDQARAAQADAALAANALAAQVARSYVGLARLVSQREVAARTLDQRQEMKELTRQRVAAGLDTRVEEVQADSALPDTRNQIEALDEQITLARHQLAALSAQAPNALDSLSPSLAQISVQRLPGTLGTDLLGRRPDVVAARWRVEAATQDIKVARTAFYPDINLTAFVGLSAIGLDQLFEAGSRQYGFTPALHLPLFDGGRLRAQLHGREAELNAAIAQYNANVLDAVREASDAIGSLQSLERQRREQAEALAGAQTAHDLALQRYRAGLGSYLIVLNTESQWLAQRRAAVDLQARELDTGIALVKALGGGWQGDAPATIAAAH
ncbi:efflux transporter outer membrane subunit [Ideonella sp. YS5]|uniref:efflux transporter outer membrane subunit n=1 Tax=Ideonella sp. YS5 TaxID=3453714 RepID=UPI003EEE6642